MRSFLCFKWMLSRGLQASGNYDFCLTNRRLTVLALENLQISRAETWRFADSACWVLRICTFTLLGARAPHSINKLVLVMAKTKRKVLDSYTVNGTNKVVRAGDCVLMRALDSNKPPYVAKVEKIEEGSKTNVRVRVRWYYRPEDSIGGRRQFHGTKELFLSDHYDEQSADTIEGKCTVHTFRSYTKLESVGNDDYFCRFEYKAASGSFSPDRVAVYCKCEMPYNPDDLMVQCDACKDWFHPECLKMSPKAVKKLDHYFCPDCSAQNGEKKPRKLRSNDISPQKTKPQTKRRKR